MIYLICRHMCVSSTANAVSFIITVPENSIALVKYVRPSLKKMFLVGAISRSKSGKFVLATMLLIAVSVYRNMQDKYRVKLIKRILYQMFIHFNFTT